MIIKNKDQLDKVNQSIFVDFNFSFYIIYEYSHKSYVVLQLLRLNEGNYQWMSIGKPFVFKNQYETVKQAILDMIIDEQSLYAILLENRSYSNVIELLNTANIIPYLETNKC